MTLYDDPEFTQKLLKMLNEIYNPYGKYFKLVECKIVDEEGKKVTFEKD